MASYLTGAEIEALSASALGRTTPFLIQGVTTSQLSVARHYGGCTFQGRSYLYIPTTDELVRDDVMAWLARHRRNARRAKEAPSLWERED